MDQQHGFTRFGSFWKADDRPPEHHETSGDLPPDCLQAEKASLALIPIRHGTDMLGLLYLADERPHFFDLEQVHLYERLASNIALGLLKQQALVALTRSERMFSSIFVNAPLLMTISEPEEGHFLEVNDAFVKVTGYNHDEAIWRTPDELGLITAQTCQELRDKLEASGRLRDRELTVRHADGSTVVLLYAGELLELGGEVLLVSTAVDITQRRKAEDALREATLLQQQMVEAGNIGMFSWDQESGRVLYSEQWKQQLGYSEDEIGDTVEEWQSRLHPDDLPVVMERVAALSKQDPVFEEEYRLRHKNGGYCWILARARAVTDESGRLVRVLGTHLDLTERRAAERSVQLIQQGTAQVTGQAFFQRLLQHLGEWLDVSWAMVITAQADGQAQVVASWGEGRCPTEVQFSLAGSPFEEVIELGTCFHADQVRSRFPESALLPELQVRSFLGTTLRDLEGQACGVLSVMSDQPMIEDPMQVHVLEFFAARAGAELIRRETEAALRQSEEQLRILFEEAADAVLLLDQDRRLLRVNKEACRTTGYSAEELLEMNLSDLEAAPNEDVAAFHLLANESAASHCRETVFACRDGRRVHVELSSARLKMPQGPLMLIIVRDITERRRGEVERERLLLAIEQAAETILITDANEAIVYVNPAFEAVTGYTRQEVIGKTPRLLKSGEQDKAFYSDMWTTLQAGKAWSGRFVNRRKNGQHFTEEAHISPVRSPEGEILNYVAVKRDITVQLSLEKQLQQAQKMQAIGRLAGGVAHDFNNMLGVIIGRCEILLQQAPDGAQSSGLEDILAAAHRSAKLTRQLLAFARKQVIAPTRIDLNSTISGMISMLCRLIGEQIQLDWQPPPEPMTILMDPNQVDQVLANLCINARDAIDDTGRITIRTEAMELTLPREELVPGAYVVLTVTDDGCGMDEDTRSKVFEPFFTTKGVGEGTGLGLATVYGIVKQNQGTIEVVSELGAGSTFTICFPAVAPAEAPAQPPAPPLPRGQRETILVVEDEPMILEMSEQILQRLGYQVIACSRATDALELALNHAQPIDLLFTDVIMPDLNGWELAQQLISHRPGLKCLFMSGHPANALPPDVLRQGMLLLEKPFSMRDLADRVRQVLEQQESVIRS